MVRNHRLSKSILDAGWGYLKQRLIDKAAEAGRQVVLVNPAHTSKTCSSCGALFSDLSLADRWVDCSCGLSMDRDVNAAWNILKRAGHALWSESTANRLRLLQEAPPLQAAEECHNRLYDQEIIQGDELGEPFQAVWKRLDEFQVPLRSSESVIRSGSPGKPPVYPDGLIELINS
jgi:hypothetical protein